MTDKTVANIILNQLGGNKFIAMTGAKNFYADDYLLGFKIGRNASGINHVKIFLNGMDTYDITWMRIRGDKINIVTEDKGIYSDQLQSLFTERTGMYTHLNPRNTRRNPNSGDLFQKFHGAQPTTRQVEFNPPKGKKLIKIGRAVSVVYEPESPSKLVGKQYEHKWGDTGDKMLKNRPLFCTDASGKNFFLINDKARPYFNERGVIG